ncbi:MAG: phosphoribosyltransferase [Polyangiaceae bacterium]|nr:phosphoribosyltransferase [Polyangiaceae bacterium]
MVREIFRDRKDAGRNLGIQLRPLRRMDPIIIGVSRGGVPVAYEVARELDAPLDVCLVRRVIDPSTPEIGIGAVAEGGGFYVGEKIRGELEMSDEDVVAAVARAWRELEARVQRIRERVPLLNVRRRNLIVVDDGMVTGASARAALDALRRRRPAGVVLALPVAASPAAKELARVADDIVCLHSEEPFIAVACWYRNYSTATDEQVIELLERARGYRAVGSSVPPSRAVLRH